MRAITTKDLYQLHLFSELLASPAKRSISYVIAQMKEESDTYQKALWVVQGNQKRCVDQEDGMQSYLWVDEDTLLVQMKYDVTKKCTPFRYCNLVSGVISQAFTLPYEVSAIKMQDTKTFVFTADIMVEPQQEDDTIVITQIPFWDNGVGFVAGKRSHMFLYRLENNCVKPLLEGTWSVSAFALCKEEVVYIAQNFTSKRELCDGVYVMNMETLTQTEILAQGAKRVDQIAAGEHLCYFSASDVAGANEEKAPNIYSYTQQGGVRKELENEYTLACNIVCDCHVGSSTSFLCEEDTLYYLKTKGHTCSLYRLKAGEETRLTFDDVTVRSFALGDVPYAIGMSKAGLEELYYLKEDTLLPITSQHAAFLSTCAVQVPQEISFTNALGNNVTGWVVYPVDYDVTKTYPGLLSIHGGPRAAFGDVFHHEMQYFSGLGYIVFYTNPRGSDGYGEAYADLRGKYGDIDYQDLMAFVDQVERDIPQVDGTRLGVLGGSYGGFMTNWIISHTDRFAAAVSQRSVANWISDFGTSCIGYQFDPNEMGADPWSNMQVMWEQSPLAYANHVKTPTLFLHSLEDYNCPVSEGMQMFTALKYFDVPSRMCLFPGENHELSRSGKPKHRERRLLEMKNWFATYLK